MEKNKAWLDKYFQPDGTPKEEEWWTQLPGGALVDVTRNWAKGYPNEGSELGWAALDAADAALAVASLGGSEVLTETAKEGGELVTKRVAKAEAKREVFGAGQRRAARDLAQRGARELQGRNLNPSCGRPWRRAPNSLGW